MGTWLNELLVRPKMSGTLSKEGDGDGITAVTAPVTGCAERFFIDDWLGGDGARVEVVCRGFVNNLDTEAVALAEVLEVGATVGRKRMVVGQAEWKKNEVHEMPEKHHAALQGTSGSSTVRSSIGVVSGRGRHGAG